MCYRQTLGRRFELGDLQEARIFCCWRRTFIHIKSASTSVRRSGGGGVCGGWGGVRSRASRRRAGGGLWRSSGIVFGAGKPKVRRRGGRALLTSRRPSARRTAMRLPVSASAPSPDCLVSCQRCSVGCRHAPPWTPPNHGIRGCDRISMCLCSTPWLCVSPELLISLLSCSTKHNKSRPWHSRVGSHVHVVVFLALIVLSSELLISLSPCIAKHDTSSAWPSRVCSHVHVCWCSTLRSCSH
jgi:hypothetical protein